MDGDNKNKGGRPKREVSAEVVLELARSGKGLGLIAKELGFSYEGFRRKLDNEPALRQAFDEGCRLADEELALILRNIIVDPSEKSNNVTQAFDKYMRHVAVTRTQQLQKSVIAQMTVDELRQLYAVLKQGELEARLGREAQTPQLEALPAKIELTEGTD